MDRLNHSYAYPWVCTQSCPTLCDLVHCSPPGSLGFSGGSVVKKLPVNANVYPSGENGNKSSPQERMTNLYSVLKSWDITLLTSDMLVAQLCPALCNPMGCSLPVSSVHGILQAEILWVAIPFSRGSSKPRDWTQVSCTAGRFFTNWATREAQLTKIYVVKAMVLLVVMYECESWP